MFTPDQILVIEQIVDRRILMHKTKQQAPARKYHTVADVRQLIIDNEAALRQQIGIHEFDIAVLRHELAKLTTLLEADREPVGTGPSSQERWDSQVLNALNLSYWPQCPIRPGSKRRSYRFIETDRLAGVVP